jgi:N-glycosylase/DNA lyase
MTKAVEFGTGIRILQQDSWEVLCSFIISQRNNIPRIKKIVASLCREFGDRFEYENQAYYTFPTAATLAQLDIDDLAPIRCGYRAEYIISAAKMIASGELILDTLLNLVPHDARAILKKIPGVGDKVADCTLLFGLHMLNVFPVDVWIKRAATEYLGREFDLSIFDPYAGIAQQYIFYYVRNSGFPRTHN